MPNDLIRVKLVNRLDGQDIVFSELTETGKNLVINDLKTFLEELENAENSN